MATLFHGQRWRRYTTPSSATRSKAQATRQHDEFIAALNEKFSIAGLQDDFANLKQLKDINSKLSKLEGLEPVFRKYQDALLAMKQSLEELRGMAKQPEHEAEGGLLDRLFGKSSKDKDKDKNRH